MRFYYRTSQRTAVSTGIMGVLAVLFSVLMLIAVPVAVIDWSFHHWYTAPVGVLIIALAVTLIIRRFR